jgi:deferrochelatase/peroxidase EfeB
MTMSVRGMITIALPLPADLRAGAHKILESWGNRVGADEASRDLRDRLDQTRLHFISAHAIDLGADARLYIEISADDADADVPIEALHRTILGEVAATMTPEWTELFEHIPGNDSETIADYLFRHRVLIGVGRGQDPGLPFCGVPGPTRQDIERQQALALRVTEILASQDAHHTNLERLAAVRGAIKVAYEEQPRGAKIDWEWARNPPNWSKPVPPTISTVGLVCALIPGFVTTFLDPAWKFVLGCGLIAAFGNWLLWYPVLADVGIVRIALASLWSFALGTVLGVVATLAWIGSIVYRLTKLEDADRPIDRAPAVRTNSAIFEKENQGAQNHMISITQRKGGPVRTLTLRFALWIIGALAGRQFKPGFLGDIGTIHFARWVALPGTDRLIFTSNYGGSWESYLEDFITLAHDGLTAIWSNTVDFPRTRLLFQRGATDGERFKRFARHSMVATPFWYSAYPDLTTANIRANAEIHRGFATITTEDEARDWLTLFGSAVRPRPKLETDEIQSLIFGGLGFLPNAVVKLVKLSSDVSQARACLGALAPFIAFNDGKRFAGRDVISLSLSHAGFRTLGLDEDALASFPLAFQTGMTGPGRDRILGDREHNAKASWVWGGTGEPDLAIIVFGPGPGASRPALADRIAEIVSRHGATPLLDIPLDPAASDAPEPFGFADGISQPVIRDTYKGLRNPDPLHVVEPGEFILGYPDNRGNLPPEPLMAAIHDKEALLPLAPDELLPRMPLEGPAANSAARERAFAQNGSYLVIRQLAQDVEGFHAYCSREATSHARRFGPPYTVTPEFIGAKLIGRWPNGSSLVRNPYDPAQTKGAALQRTISRPATGAPIPAAPASSPVKPDNDFLYGTEDPQALRCPFGAHTRRANPRDSLNPGSKDQIDISNRHRILRVGRRYSEGGEKGLMFMCLNGDLERQFEFIQQTWLGSPSFHGLSCEQDPVVGSGDVSCNGFTIPSHDGPVRLSPLHQFVTVRGGGYFFLPSQSLIRYLSRVARAVH